MFRDKRHCLQVLRFERGSANGKQSNTIIADHCSTIIRIIAQTHSTNAI